MFLIKKAVYLIINAKKGEEEMKKRSILVGALAISLLGLFYLEPSAMAQSTYRMDIQTWASGGPYLEQVKIFGKRIETMSAGRIKVNVLAGGVVAPSTKEFDALETGAIKWAVTSFNFALGRLGRVGGLFAATPAGPNPSELYAWWRWGDAKPFAEEMLKRAKADMVIVGGPVAYTGAESFGWFRKPVTSLSDFKGMKYRCMGLYGEVAKKLGAAVVNLPGGEIYQAYERGVIDAFEYCTPAMDYSAGFHNLKAVRMEPGFQSTNAALIFMTRTDTWAKVPNELKPIIEGATWASMEEYAWLMLEDAKAIKKFEEAGVKAHFLPKEVQREIVRQVDELHKELGAQDPLYKKVNDSQEKFYSQFRSVEYVCQPRYEWKYPFSR